MAVLQWNKHPVDGDFAKKLRREIRMHRRERGRSGNRFCYSELRVIWSSGDDHAIITHKDNNLWQYWWKHPSKGWFLQSWHRLLSDAKEEAEQPRPLEMAPAKNSPGTYIYAYWDSPYSGGPMMVRCSTDYTASQIREVFRSLGCSTELKTVV